jgi:hypothetical protein
MNWDKFIEKLKEPSTIKAIILFASLAGVAIDQTKMNEIVAAGGVLYGLIAMFWQKS